MGVMSVAWVEIDWEQIEIARMRYEHVSGDVSEARYYRKDLTIILLTYIIILLLTFLSLY